MPLNEQRQVINEKNVEVCIWNAMIVLNEEDQNTSNIVVPLNSEESISNAEQLISCSTYIKLGMFIQIKMSLDYKWNRTNV